MNKNDKIDQERILQQLYDVSSPVSAELGVSLVDIEYLQDGGYWYVRIYIEKENGDISLEDCAAFSGAVEDKIDSIIDNKFFLEVSSPGLERPLKKPADYVRFEGKKAKIVLTKKLDDKKEFEGVIASSNDHSVTIDIEGSPMTIEYKSIKKANLVYDFENI